ncbi:MAG TPA: trehalose-phosphatase [Gaiellaceae bacterium]
MDALAHLSADPKRAALFLDVDGVLAPIVARPEDASVPEPTRQELRRLAARYALVACVTGRPGEVAKRIVGVPELRYAGEHGLELEPAAPAFADTIHRFARASGWPDVEEKPLSAALHFRTAEDPDAARHALETVAARAAAAGLRPVFGRMVLDILPPVQATKGTAVSRLLAEAAVGRALYAGDDTTDLDGFAALDGLELAVRVAVADPESPAELRARADVLVDSPAAFAELLGRL